MTATINSLRGWAAWCYAQDLAPEIQRALIEGAELLENEHRAADRYAKELATLRESARNDEQILNNEIDRLQAGINACIEFTPDSEVREMLEALVRGVPE